MGDPKNLSGSVKKSFSVAALTVLTGLLLSGCSGAPAPSVDDTAKPTATATNWAIPLPKANPAQEEKLMAELKKIDPALDSPRSIQFSRQECRLILLNSPEENQISFAQHLSRSAGKPGSNSDEKAKKIIAVIKNSDFCKTVTK